MAVQHDTTIVNPQYNVYCTMMALRCPESERRLPGERVLPKDKAIIIKVLLKVVLKERWELSCSLKRLEKRMLKMANRVVNRIVNRIANCSNADNPNIHPVESIL